MTTTEARNAWPTKILSGALVLYAVSATISIAAAQTGAILAALVWWVATRGRIGAQWPLARPLGAFLLAGLATGVFSTDRAESFSDLGGEWIATALFFVCVNALGPEPRLSGRVRLLIGATTLSALYGISQVFTKGIDYRVHGFLGHYSTFGSVLALVALLAAAQFLFRSQYRRDLWLVAAFAILLVALTLTQSRAGILGFLLGAAILAGFRNWRLLLLVPLLGAVVVVAAPGDLKSRVTGIFDLSDITARERVYMWSAGAAMFRAHPLLGVGPGASRPQYVHFEHPDDPRVHEPPAHLHNNIVNLAAERGLLGTLPWIWIWLAFFRRTYDIYRRLPPDDTRGRALVLGSLACAASFLLTGMADYTHGDSEVTMLMYFTMALPFALRQGPTGTMSA